MGMVDRLDMRSKDPGRADNSCNSDPCTDKPAAVR